MIIYIFASYFVLHNICTINTRYDINDMSPKKSNVRPAYNKLPTLAALFV